jgi:KaiC/GvpD/RAD55 family RecA-like ATPase
VSDIELREKLEIAAYENGLLERGRSYFNTSFGFLENVNGWRKGKVHVILGTTSSGKSTFVRSIIWDLIKNNKLPNVACFLSEETISDYSLEIYEAFRNLDFKKRISFFSEQDASNKAEQLDKAFKSDAHVLVYDNITTSMLYGEKFDQQGAFALKLKEAAHRTNKAVIVIAHTNNVHRNSRDLIDSTHLRGSKTLAMIAEFFFINHQLNVKGNLYNFIQIEKHRGQRPSDKIFRLDYDAKRNIFKKDVVNSFDDFKELWKIRDKL